MKKRLRSLRKGDTILVSQHGVVTTARVRRFGPGEIYWDSNMWNRVRFRDHGLTWHRLDDMTEEDVLAFRARIALLR